MAQNFTWPAVSVPAPVGGATAANQVLEIAQLTAINSNTAGLLTDAELRATPVPVSGPLTDAQLRASAVPVSGPLTDAQLRASAVPVSGPLTDAQLRASPLPLPTDAATETTLLAIDTKIPAGLTISSARLLVDGSGVTQPVSAASLPLPTGAATAAKQPALGTAGTASADVITVQGIAAMTPLLVNGSGVTQPVSIASTVSVATVPPAATTVKQAAVSVGTTAVRATTDGSAPGSTRSVLVITPDPSSSATFYVGSSSVANSGSSRGVPIVAGQSIAFSDDAADYYIIASAAAQTVFIMEQE